MRVRVDPTSYHASGVLRRDARAAKDELSERPVASAKNTKRWCRGRVGVEHQGQCFRRETPIIPARYHYQLICTVCGKHLDWYWPMVGVPSQKPKPAWLVEA